MMDRPAELSVDAAQNGQQERQREAARDLIAENADCRRPAVACGAGGTGTGGCGCLITADAVLQLAGRSEGGPR